MDAPHERLASLRDLLRKADRQSPSEADQDFRRRRNVEDGAATSAEVVPTGSTIEDWSGTLHLVATAGERMLATEGRVRDLERELQRESESASEEIERLRAQISELQDHLTDALQGRSHAEEWLRRLSEAVRDRFAEAGEVQHENVQGAAQAS